MSGTADNCLFTNFAFMQRNKGGYAFRTETDKSPINIVEERDSDLEEDVSIDEPPKEVKKRNSI